MRLFQYQAKTEPLQRLQLDTTPSAALQQPASIPLRNWLVQRTLPINSIAPSVFYVPLVNTPAYYTQEVNILQYPRTTQYQRLAGNIAPLATAAPTVDGYTPSNPHKVDRLKNSTYTYPYFFTDALSLTIKERTTPDKWLGSKPDKLFDVQRRQYQYPSTFDDIGLLQGTPPQFDDVAEYQTNQPRFDIKRNQYLYPSFTIDTVQLTRGTFVSIDKWLGSRPDKLFDLKRLQYLYPYFSTDIHLFAKPDELFEVAIYQTNIPRFDIKRLQHLYPSGANGYPYYSPSGCDCEPLTNWNSTTIEETNWSGDVVQDTTWVEERALVSNLLYNSTMLYNTTNLYNGILIQTGEPPTPWNTTTETPTSWAGGDAENTSNWNCC